MSTPIKQHLRSFLFRHEAIILTYHSVLENPLPFPVWQHMTAAAFERQIAYLAEHFRCVSMSTLLDDIARGEIPPYTVAVTFDDGYRNNFSQALPILRRYNVPATLFITHGFISNGRMLWPEWIICALGKSKLSELKFAGQILPLHTNEARETSYRTAARLFKQLLPEHIPAHIDALLEAAQLTRAEVETSDLGQTFTALNWDEIRQMQNSGLFEFGAHTQNHWRLTQLNSAQARCEIVDTKALLESQIGRVDYFAYPHGNPDDYDASHRALAIEAGYRAVFTALTHTITPQSDIFDLPRMGVGENMSDEEFIYAVQGGTAAIGDADWATRFMKLFGA